MNQNTHLMKKLASITLLLVMASLAQAQDELPSPDATPDMDAVLTRVMIEFDTPPDVQNGDASVELTLTRGDPTGGPFIATGKAPVKTGHSDWINLDLAAKGLKRKDLSNAALLIRFRPNPSRQRWIFTYRVRFNYSDGLWSLHSEIKKTLLEPTWDVETENVGTKGLESWRP
jgi:hypothetical protein